MEDLLTQKFSVLHLGTGMFNCELLFFTLELKQWIRIIFDEVSLLLRAAWKPLGSCLWAAQSNMWWELHRPLQNKWFHLWNHQCLTPVFLNNKLRAHKLGGHLYARNCLHIYASSGVCVWAGCGTLVNNPELSIIRLHLPVALWDIE